MESQIIKLNPRHYKILDFCVAGLTAQQISKELNMTECMVSVIMRSPSFQHELAIRRKSYEENLDEKLAESTNETARLLRDHSAMAAKALVSGLLSNSEAIKFRSAEAILDRTGNPRTSRTLSENYPTTINISSEDLQLLKETLEITNGPVGSPKVAGVDTKDNKGAPQAPAATISPNEKVKSERSNLSAPSPEGVSE